MPYNAEPGEVAYVTAGVAVRHGAPAADDGFCGTAVKTATPSAETVRADRNLIAAGEGYTLLIDGVIEVPAASVPGIAKGALVFIDPDDNVVSAAQAGNNVVLGKVASLPGERGTPSDKVRVNLELKV